MHQALTEPFIWEKYNKRVRHKIAHPKASGLFSEKEWRRRSLRLVTAESGSLARGARVRLHLLVDLTDAVLVDARYEVFGPTALVAALEATVEIIVGKNYVQVKKVGADLIDQHLREARGTQALPSEAQPYLGLLLDVLEKATDQCKEIPLKVEYRESPVTKSLVQGESIENWLELSSDEQLLLVREIVDKEIRPYVEMDGGGVTVVRIQKGTEVVILYSGACNGCFSSTGATLSGIESILQSKIDPAIRVLPEF